ncbi:tail sheath protein [Pseudaeromonas phage vB_PpeM_ KLEP7]|nr:tail sheath protein [Pseudaeromonas phage vB_PpeM_ KLEP7]
MSSTFIPEVVEVTVDVSGAQPLDTETFELPLFIAAHNLNTTRVPQSYSTLAQVTAAGFAVGSPVYNFCKNCFNGLFRPSLVKIGRQAVSSYDVDFNGYTQVGTDVTVSLVVNDVVKSFTATATETTATAIAAKIVALIEADVTFGPLVVATALAGVMTIAPTASEKISVGVQSGKAKISADSTETPTDAFNAIYLVDQDYFYVASDDHLKASQKTLATAVSAYNKPFIYSTLEATVKDKANTTNVFAEMKAMQNDWALGFYHELADLEFPEGSVIGATASISFDSNGPDSLHQKTLKGLTVSTLTTTEREAIEFHNGNYAIMYRGAGSMFNGFMASGQFFDTMKFSAWLESRIKESVYGLQKRASDAGKSMTFSNNDLPRIKAAIQSSPINTGIRYGSILEGYDPETNENFDPIITVPTRGQVTTDNLANRILDGVTVEVVYNCPLHYVKIKAYVVLTRQTA